VCLTNAHPRAPFLFVFKLGSSTGEPVRAFSLGVGFALAKALDCRAVRVRRPSRRSQYSYFATAHLLKFGHGSHRSTDHRTARPKVCRGFPALNCAPAVPLIEVHHAPSSRHVLLARHIRCTGTGCLLLMSTIAAYRQIRSSDLHTVQHHIHQTGRRSITADQEQSKTHRRVDVLLLRLLEGRDTGSIGHRRVLRMWRTASRRLHRLSLSAQASKPLALFSPSICAAFSLGSGEWAGGFVLSKAHASRPAAHGFLISVQSANENSNWG